MADLRVVAARWEAEDITSYVLVDIAGGELPKWEPGSHIDVTLPSGLVRQYSLCGDPDDRRAYRIAVLAQPDGRGGSIEAHRSLLPGVRVAVSAPRSTFTLHAAERYVFVAGGVGITPLVPMVLAAHRRGTPWELIYGARSPSHFAFEAELRALGPVRCQTGPLDPESVVTTSVGAHVYACGPAGLLDALSSAFTAAGRPDELHVERFAPAALVHTSDGFEMELARSGVVVPVGSDTTILEAVRAAGVEAPSSCEMGFCGTCETKVLSGEIDHHDDLLTAAERAAGNTMMICVSRAACPRLVLDL